MRRVFPNPWISIATPALEIHGNFGLRQLFGIKCIRFALWKNIPMARACIIIFLAGLAIICACIICYRIRHRSGENCLPTQRAEPLPLDPPPVASPEPSPAAEPTPISKIGAGIPNLGATCYLNSSIQALHRCDHFSDTIRVLAKLFGDNSEFDAIRILGEIFAYLDNPTIEDGLPQPCKQELAENFLSTIDRSGMWEHSASEQCDAHEFISTLLNKIEVQLNELPQRKANDLVDAAIADSVITIAQRDVLLRANIYRPDGKTSTNVAVDFGFNSSCQAFGRRIIDGWLDEESFPLGGLESCLFLNVDPQNGNLPAALEAMKHENVQYGGLGLVNKETKLLSSPRTLMFQIVRFNYENSAATRNNNRFEFPSKLDLSQFNASVTGNVQYKLSSIISHIGTCNGGHYVSYAKIGDTWIEFNDSSTRQVLDSEIETLYGGGTSGEIAYILFFEKTT
ncbi:MAG: hypothetical protein LBI34_01920 [Puniceicoccales bacterium]|jgi:hypothetical protein|nr:hypothetical protein [Puniceicoccales bacterium]